MDDIGRDATEPTGRLQSNLFTLRRGAIGRFRAKFGKNADATSASGFDSMNAVIEAIRRAGSTDGDDAGCAVASR